MAKKDTIEVQATGPIRHGDADGTTSEFDAGDKFTVTMAQAKQLVEAGAVVQPGTKLGGVSKEEKEAAKTEAKIDAANDKAEADRLAAAEAAGKA